MCNHKKYICICVYAKHVLNDQIIYKKNYSQTVYAGLTVVTIAPASKHPRNAMGVSGKFGKISATVSPDLVPNFNKLLAM